MEEIKENLIKHYSAEPAREITLIREGVDNDVYTFYDTGNNKLIARVSKTESIPSVKFEAKLIKHLTEEKVPIASLVFTGKNKPFVKVNSQKVITCFEFIEGGPIKYGPEYNPKTKFVKQAGTALGNFHKATLNLELKEKRKRTIYTELDRVIKNKNKIWQSYQGGKEFINNVFDAYKKAENTNSAWGIIHNDYNTSNLLFHNDDLKAVIDFDWACPGPLLMDVGYGAMSWSTAKKDTKPNQKVFCEFISGYNQTSPIKVEKNKEFWFWTAYSCLYLASGFLSNMLIENKYNITSVKQSHMYRRYLYYIKKLN